MSNLRCTYCGGELVIYMASRGSPWNSEQYPESIECNGSPGVGGSYACGAEWEPNGTLRTAGPCQCGDPACDGTGQYR